MGAIYVYCALHFKMEVVVCVTIYQEETSFMKKPVAQDLPNENWIWVFGFPTLFLVDALESDFGLGQWLLLVETKFLEG